MNASVPGLAFLTTLFVAVSCVTTDARVQVEFAETACSDAHPSAPTGEPCNGSLLDRDKDLIEAVIREVEADVRTLMPALDAEVRVTVVLVDRDLSSVAGVSGRAPAPGQVIIELSTDFAGGVRGQLPGLRRAMFHELHHLVRGWTIAENRFGPGIAIAAVNEGLADVFAEEQTGVFVPAGEYPDDVDEWAEEILSLPSDASYGTWMFAHSDGRLAIGYRTGRYIVHRAMANSGRSALSLSDLSPDEILRLAGLH